MSLTIGVDIGGTKVLGGVVDPAGRVLTHTRRDTPADDVPRTRELLIDVVAELAAAHDVEAAGIGAAGWIDASRSTVLFAPNLAWRDEPLRQQLAAAMDLPIVVENDGNAAAWAEFRFGAARDAESSMVMFTIGTGIGGGIVLGGQVVRGAHGMAAEPGHTNLIPGGRPCGCGRYGCVEQYASGSALVRYARTAAVDDPGRAAAMLAGAGGRVEGITGSVVTAAAHDGDKAALDAFAEVGRWLGVALADQVQVLDPEVFVIGGGVAEAGELLLGPTRESFVASLAQRGMLPVGDVRGAEMGNLAGVVGAADLARRR